MLLLRVMESLWLLLLGLMGEQLNGCTFEYKIKLMFWKLSHNAISYTAVSNGGIRFNIMH